MIEVVFAIAPVFLLILIGWAMRHFDFPGNSLWVPAEKLTYFVLFPALLFRTTATNAVEASLLAPLMVAAGASVLVVAMVMIVTRRWWRADDAAFTSLFQGAIRPNTYVGLALAAALIPDGGLSLIAAQAVVVIPLVNLLAVLVLVKWGHVPGGRAMGPWALIKPVIQNPLILACLCGGTWNALGWPLPDVVSPVLEILGRASLPLALLATGAGLNFDTLKSAKAVVVLSGLMKLLAAPLITLGLGLAFGLTGDNLLAVMIYASLPVSVSSYMLARQMGGDGPLAAGVITATTLASALTITALVLGFPYLP